MLMVINVRFCYAELLLTLSYVKRNLQLSVLQPPIGDVGWNFCNILNCYNLYFCLELYELFRTLLKVSEVLLLTVTLFIC